MPQRPPKGMGGLQPPGAKEGDTDAHAREVRALASGVDIVERTLSRPQADHSASSAVPSKDMLVVRAWAEKRTLDATPQASAMVSFPRMWTTKRGRYAKFKAPGAGVYGLVRARPTF